MLTRFQEQIYITIYFIHQTWPSSKECPERIIIITPNSWWLFYCLPGSEDLIPLTLLVDALIAWPTSRLLASRTTLGSFLNWYKSIFSDNADLKEPEVLLLPISSIEVSFELVWTLESEISLAASDVFLRSTAKGKGGVNSLTPFGGPKSRFVLIFPWITSSVGQTSSYSGWKKKHLQNELNDLRTISCSALWFVRFNLTIGPWHIKT